MTINNYALQLVKSELTNVNYKYVGAYRLRVTGRPDFPENGLKVDVAQESVTGLELPQLVAMLSLGIGLQQLASRRLQKSGLFDTVVVSSRRDLRNFRDPPFAIRLLSK